jgi:large subunit ribosomal protein L1
MAPLLSSFHQQVRGAKSNPQAKYKKANAKSKKEKKGPREFKQKDLKDIEQFALCDAIR